MEIDRTDPMLKHVGTREQPADVIGTFRLMYLSIGGSYLVHFTHKLCTGHFYCSAVEVQPFLSSNGRSSQRTNRPTFNFGQLVLHHCHSMDKMERYYTRNRGRLLFPAAPAMAILIASGWCAPGKFPVNLARLWAGVLPLCALHCYFVPG
jgi:hypothetical protein